MSYEIKFKERVLSWRKMGLSQREATRLFGISRNTLADWLARRNSGEGLSPRELVPRMEDPVVVIAVHDQPVANAPAIRVDCRIFKDFTLYYGHKLLF